MLKKFALWFICFGLSFLVADVFGWTDQGKAFLYIHLGTGIIIIAIIILVVFIAGGLTNSIFEGSAISLLAALVTFANLAIILFATWGATKLFEVNFYVAYQIMTFGQQCLCVEKKED